MLSFQHQKCFQILQILERQQYRYVMSHGRPRNSVWNLTMKHFRESMQLQVSSALVQHQTSFKNSFQNSSALELLMRHFEPELGEKIRINQRAQLFGGWFCLPLKPRWPRTPSNPLTSGSLVLGSQDPLKKNLRHNLGIFQRALNKSESGSRVCLQHRRMTVNTKPLQPLWLSSGKFTPIYLPIRELVLCWQGKSTQKA